MNQIHTSSLAQDELSIDIDVAEDAPLQRQRPEDTWDTLGRAIGDARAEEIVRASERRVVVAPYIAAPPSRHLVQKTPPARVPESLYPVELPSREVPAVMSAQHPAFPWKESADASLSIAVPVQKPRALRTARIAVGVVTGVGALICVIALLLSRVNAEPEGAAVAAQPPPEAQTSLPEKTTTRSDNAREQSAANAPSTSWTKNVIGNADRADRGDRPGVSVDSLPRADPRPAPRKAGKKR